MRPGPHRLSAIPVETIMRGAATVLLIVLAVAGCRFRETGAPGAAQQARDAAAAAQTATAGPVASWETRVLPYLRDAATDWPVLAAALAEGADAAGARYGRRPSAEGAPWTFSARVAGVVTAADVESRAATVSVDTDGDGATDLVLQLGPVIRGTALRDSLPFIDISDYRDQIEFAQLSRDLNAMAFETALRPLPRERLVGARVEALGAFTLRAAGAPPLLTPVEIAVGAP